MGLFGCWTVAEQVLDWIQDRGQRSWVLRFWLRIWLNRCLEHPWVISWRLYTFAGKACTKLFLKALPCYNPEGSGEQLFWAEHFLEGISSLISGLLIHNHFSQGRDHMLGQVNEWGVTEPSPSPVGHSVVHSPLQSAEFQLCAVKSRVLYEDKKYQFSTVLKSCTSLTPLPGINKLVMCSANNQIRAPELHSLQEVLQRFWLHLCNCCHALSYCAETHLGGGVMSDCLPICHNYLGSCFDSCTH